MSSQSGFRRASGSLNVRLVNAERDASSYFYFPDDVGPARAAELAAMTARAQCVRFSYMEVRLDTSSLDPPVLIADIDGNPTLAR
jgi:hypothetical protein